MNELEKRAKQHRKKHRGLALSYLNTNAGNVEHNVAMFNKMNNPIDATINNPISGPFGGEVSAPVASGDGGGMGESLELTEALNISTSYMLRNDGQLFECGDVYPYICPQLDRQPRSSIRLLFAPYKEGEPLKWFYNHTKDELTKQDIELFLVYLKRDFKYYVIQESIIDKLLNELNIDFNSYATQIRAAFNYTQVESLFKIINHRLNQEFCRVRISDNFIGGSTCDIYFRISSHAFNWFDLIWDFVNANSNWISTVTIEAEGTSKGSKYIYKFKDIIFDHIMTDEFLSIEASPVIEELEDIQESNNMITILEYYNPQHYSDTHDGLYQFFLEDNFINMNINESIEKNTSEMIDLEYEDISVTVYGEQRDADDWDEWEVTTDWTYKVDKNDIEVLIIEDYLSDEDLPGWDDMSDEDVDKFVSEHFDELFTKYEEQIKDHYYDEACEDVQNRYEYEPDYPEYDPYDEQDLWEELHKPIRKNSVLDEGNVDDNFDIFLRGV